MGDPNIDGVITCSIAQGDMWSFAEVPQDRDGAKITKVAEKLRISKWCSVGLYNSRETTRFFELAEQALANHQSTEYYVAPIYNSLLKAGANIVLDVAEEFRPMGSLERIHSI